LNFFVSNHLIFLPKQQKLLAGECFCGAVICRLTKQMQPNCQAVQFLKLVEPVKIIRRRIVVAGLANRLICVALAGWYLPSKPFLQHKTGLSEIKICLPLLEILW
jgi:hypothetical protein